MVECLNSCDMYFANSIEAEMLRSLPVNIAIPKVIMLGAMGAIYLEHNTLICAPALALDALDPTGAGDVLSGTFLGLRAAGQDVQTALKKTACVMASRKTTGYGLDALLATRTNG